MKRVRINKEIIAPQLRVILSDGTNLGVLVKEKAVLKAEELGLDLVEISPASDPPIAKIIDFGKYLYLEKKKEKERKEKAHVVETKSIQVKIGTGEHDLEQKARQASSFLKDGHRVRIELFLRGRAKYMEEKFLRERLERITHLLTEDYAVVDSFKKSPKGMSIVIEKGKKVKEQKEKIKKEDDNENQQVVPETIADHSDGQGSETQVGTESL